PSCILFSGRLVLQARPFVAMRMEPALGRLDALLEFRLKRRNRVACIGGAQLTDQLVHLSLVISQFALQASLLGIQFRKTSFRLRAGLMHRFRYKAGIATDRFDLLDHEAFDFACWNRFGGTRLPSPSLGGAAD